MHKRVLSLFFIVSIIAGNILILGAQKVAASEYTPEDLYLLRKAVSYCRSNVGRERVLDCGRQNFSKTPGGSLEVTYHNQNNYCARFSLPKGVRIYGAVYKPTSTTPPTFYHNGSTAKVTPCLRYADITTQS